MTTSLTTRADPGRLTTTERRSRKAVLALFAVDGFGFGAWAAHLPAFKSGLGLSDGGLSVPLFAMVAGGLVAMPLAGRFISARGSRGLLLASACLYGLVLPWIALAVRVPGGMAWFTLAALVFGAAKGALDVSANAQAVGAERDGSRPIVSTCHGCWSLGSLCGAGAAALALRFALPPALTMLAVCVVLLEVTLASAGDLRTGDRVEPGSGSGSGRRASLRTMGWLAPLGLLAFLALFCEGAVADWGAVYLAGPVGVTPASAAFGFTVYMLAMTLARFAGDKLAARFGPAGLLRAGGLMVAAGLGGALAFGTYPAALAGFAVVGLGLANAVPVIFRAAGKGRDAGAAIAAVSTLGYLGFLAGPPMIGALSEALGLPVALTVVVAFGVTVALCAGIAGARPEPGEAPGRREHDNADARPAVLAS